MVAFSFVYITLYTSTYVVAVMFRLSTIYETKRTKKKLSEIQRFRFGACTAPMGTPRVGRPWAEG